jgi:HSP90 family molecular chaperone
LVQKRLFQSLGASSGRPFVALPLVRAARALAVPCDGVARRNFSSAPEGEETHSFQAETRQLLDIVTNSLYTDKEVFLRELVSNASDALEKLRHLQATGMETTAPDADLEVTINVDAKLGTITLTDSGVGMTRDEMVSLLGTIARSGSKAFVAEAKAAAAGTSGGGGGEGAEAAPKAQGASSAAESIIGQFGVGFYSAFMVGKRVDVASTPAAVGAPSHLWSSDGSGTYSVRPLDAADAPARGCRMTIHLKEAHVKEFADPARLKAIVKKYSNFVNFPIKVNGEVVNTVQAVWTKPKGEVSDDEYNDFYQFLTSQFDEPAYRLHFRADAPLDLKVLLYIPSYHTEKWGGGHLTPGVSLYSRKVLIEKDAPGLLPEWMRFVKGVVDSEDLPLAISREKAQDSKLLKRIEAVLVKRVLKFLAEQATKEPGGYKKWFKEFGFFLKEGACRDFTNKDDIAKLLFFESSTLKDGELTSFDEYIARCTPDQDKVYFLQAPNRSLAEQSPYYEAFKESGREVLFVYNAIDDFVMNNLQTYNKRKIVSAEDKDIDLGAAKENDAKADAKADAAGEDKVTPLNDASVEILAEWMVKSLPKKLAKVRATKRLKESPAIITEHESGSLRRMMRMVEQQNTGVASSEMIAPQTLEINPAHPLVVGIETLRSRGTPEDIKDAKLILEQVVDNAFVSAGILDDSRGMVTRVNALMLRLLHKHAAAPAPRGFHDPEPEPPAPPADGVEYKPLNIPKPF